MATTFTTVAIGSTRISNDTGQHWLASPDDMMTRNGIFAFCLMTPSSFSDTIDFFIDASAFAAITGRRLTSIQITGRMYGDSATDVRFGDVLSETFTGGEITLVPEQAIVQTAPGPVNTFTAYSDPLGIGSSDADRTANLASFATDGMRVTFGCRNVNVGVARQANIDDVRVIIGSDDPTTSPGSGGYGTHRVGFDDDDGG